MVDKEKQREANRKKYPEFTEFYDELKKVCPSVKVIKFEVAK